MWTTAKAKMAEADKYFNRTAQKLQIKLLEEQHHSENGDNASNQLMM